MPSLTIYLDEKTLRAVEKAAKRGKESISGWARRHLAEASSEKPSWPEGYFDKMAEFGGTDLEEPTEPEGELDEIRLGTSNIVMDADD